jgi:hypothetical protein
MIYISTEGEDWPRPLGRGLWITRVSDGGFSLRLIYKKDRAHYFRMRGFRLRRWPLRQRFVYSFFDELGPSKIDVVK